MHKMIAAKYLTVSQLTRYIKAKFDQDPYMKTVYVTGEISGFRDRGHNSHQYFTLKDQETMISAVMFRGPFKKLKFKLADGQKVLIKGYVSLFSQRGSYQLYVEEIEPDGIGALYLAYEQLKEKLSKEGLFDFTHKDLHRFPKKIAVITSPSGAVIRDIITTVKRRYPLVQLVLYPSDVQGAKASGSLVKRIQEVSQDLSYDCLIVGRGGGSLEDLWCFNEETVARAIAACPLPVISCVGHETDTTLVDFVSDLRAATPTAAAELATPYTLTDTLLGLKKYQEQLHYLLVNRLKHSRQRLGQISTTPSFSQPERYFRALSQQVDILQNDLNQTFLSLNQKRKETFVGLARGLEMNHPKLQILQAKNQLRHLQINLEQSIKQSMHFRVQAVDHLISQLEALSPINRLKTGYAFVSVEDQPIKSVSCLDIGETLSIQFADGNVKAKIIEKQEEGQVNV